MAQAAAQAEQRIAELAAQVVLAEAGAQGLRRDLEGARATASAATTAVTAAASVAPAAAAAAPAPAVAAPNEVRLHSVLPAMGETSCTYQAQSKRVTFGTS